MSYVVEWLQRMRRLKLPAAAFLLALSVGWATESAKEILDGFLEDAFSLGKMSINVFYISVYVISFYLVYQIVKRFVPGTRHLEVEPIVIKRKCLIVFLSELKGLTDVESCNGATHSQYPLNYISLSDDIESITAKKREFRNTSSDGRYPVWQWEMPLRAINHHSQDGTLEKVIVLCSNESLRQLNCFVEILDRYKGKDDNIKNIELLSFLRWMDGYKVVPTSAKWNSEVSVWDFENFDQLSSGVLWLFDWLRTQGLKEKDIVVDFTGGRKVTSVVAVSVTFNRKITSQYVQTGDPWGVIGYDVVVEGGFKPGI